MKGNMSMKINVRQIVVAGVLSAIAIVLGVTQLGFIPVPNLSGSATIMHIPVILGAVLGSAQWLASWLEQSSVFTA
jgi:uncharacterized membrane protein